MSELKSCPYCGHEPDSRISDTDGNKYYTCGSKWCRNGNWYTLEEWNARPLEDALQNEIDFVENKADQFNEGFQAARNGEPDRPIELEESNAWMEGYAYGAYLPMKQRITELEAQLAQVAKENDWMKYPEPPESGAK